MNGYYKRVLRGMMGPDLFTGILKNMGYLPTAVKVWGVLKQSRKRHVIDQPYMPLPDEISNIQNNEFTELTERANWLIKEVIVSDPEQLINKMPKIIGREYQGQWAIYACSMTASALCNLIRLFPQTKSQYLPRVVELINLVNTPTIRMYDTMMWKEDALETLDGNKSHMTYLSILAWMIGQYRLAGGDSRYDPLHSKLCETLNRRMRKSRDLNLPSFPNGIVFLPDMMFCLIALKEYGILNKGVYDDTIEDWLEMAKSHWIDKKSGLLYSYYYRNKKTGRVSGAYAGLNCTGLVQLDEEFGLKQFRIMKSILGFQFGKESDSYMGIKEYLRRSNTKISFDINAGPVILGLSPSGTAFSMGAATYLGDWSFRKGLLATAELGGHTVKSRKARHYKLAEIMLTGEAITLAMRTMVNFNHVQK